MSDENDERTNKKLSSRQLLRRVLKRMGQQTPEEQALEFKRRYLARWMKKSDRGDAPDMR